MICAARGDEFGGGTKNHVNTLEIILKFGGKINTCNRVCTFTRIPAEHFNPSLVETNGITIGMSTWVLPRRKMASKSWRRCPRR